MKIITNDHIVPFDIDDTLIMWDTPQHVELPGMIVIDGYKLMPNFGNINKLKEMHVKGQLVIAWSAAGYDWAARVVDKLGLTEYVDMVMTKPRVYFDDLNADEWMKRLYVKNILG